MPNPPEQARNHVRFQVVRRSRLLDAGAVEAAGVVRREAETEGRRIFYLPHELLTTEEDREAVDQILEDVGPDAIDPDGIEDRRRDRGGRTRRDPHRRPLPEDLRSRPVRRDPMDVARRIKQRQPELVVGPEHVLTPAQGWSVGPGSDPYPTEAAVVRGDAFLTANRLGVIDTGQWNGEPQVPCVLQPFDTDPVDVTHPRGIIDYPEAGHGGFIAGIVGNASADCIEVVSTRAYDSDGLITESEVINAIDRARLITNVVVLNLSLGTYTDGADTVLLRRKLREWDAAGLLLVAAAGNDHTEHPWFPAAFAGEKRYADMIVSVGALGRRPEPGTQPAVGDYAAFSNRGDWVTAWAKGVGVVSAYPRDKKFLYEGSADAADFVNGLAEWDGTSFAAPLVAAEIMRVAAAETDDDVRDAWRLLRHRRQTAFWPGWLD